MFVDLTKEIDELDIDMVSPKAAENFQEIYKVLQYYRGYVLVNKNLREPSRIQTLA